MGTQEITARIISDAEADAKALVENAEAKAAEILAEAAKTAEQGRRAVEADVAEKRESILEKKAAAARLESAKILLGEKHRVIDAVYRIALQDLLALEKEDCLRLVGGLLEKYAEAGDELFFAENFDYKTDVALLPVIAQKGLKISAETLPLDGGLVLKGEKSDKDLSYGALLAADRENHQAEIAKKLFS
ncbi:MAG: hypothetical protein IJX87_03970 [Clostridia bacterium]|nr:hypothetical protein [Clostridia bacterium]